MLFGLAKIIGSPGSRVPFSLQPDFSDLDFGNCRAAGPVLAEGYVENKAGVLLLEATISAEIQGVCDRCTNEFLRKVSIPVHAVLETDPDSADPDDIWTFSVIGDSVDLEEIVRTAFVFGIDSKMLCKPDCKGLCCHCGADLNIGPCDCKPEPDARFDVLRQWLDNNK